MSINRFFILLFILSLSVFILFKFYPQNQIEDKIGSQHIDKKMNMSQKSSRLPSISIETNLESSNDFILITSFITSILSFFGFIISSYFSIKGNRRDEEIFNLQKDREQLEMEKIQAEIRALTKDD